jgi:double-GTPase-like protein
VSEPKDDRDVDVFEADDSDREDTKHVDWIRLPTADLLSVEDADELLRRRAANIVAVIGERKGGKTTLIAEIYERFLRGPFAGQLFADSQTLLGFEKKSYPSRAETGAEKPDTVRTSLRDGLTFFHLGLVSETDNLRRDLLLSERAGDELHPVRLTPA